PSQAQFAAGVAKNLMEAYLAPEKRDRLIQTGLMALGVVLVINFIGNWLSNKIARKIAKKLKD
ncbi:hypothetical protein MNBD_CHLOROFLEXI01-1923, partial [hydrothermal vent metagenome]